MKIIQEDQSLEEGDDRAGNNYHGEYVEEDFIEQAVVEVSVAVKGNEVLFDPPLEETHEHLLNCLTAIIQHNQRIPRVEKLLFPGAN
ncbi:hypothetical protein SK128_024562 [Halocaridina rubra]|uniref:Uncharacterized protein n=1 Tax=Halocaridina rubra TaxID=373956 RepID=A0AAN9AAL0_HALRR